MRRDSTLFTRRFGVLNVWLLVALAVPSDLSHGAPRQIFGGKARPAARARFPVGKWLGRIFNPHGPAMTFEYRGGRWCSLVDSISEEGAQGRYRFRIVNGVGFLRHRKVEPTRTVVCDYKIVPRSHNKILSITLQQRILWRGQKNPELWSTVYDFDRVRTGPT